MFLSSHWIAGGCILALALSSAIPDASLTAQATQDTAHKTGTMQMPMNIPMGKKPQKKTSTPKSSAAIKTSGTGNTTKTGKRSPPANTSKRRVGTVKSRPMTMSTRAESHRAPAAGKMQMSDTTRKMQADSAHPTGGMNMQSAPGITGVPTTPGMAGMQMPPKPIDSPHTGMPGMQHHSADDMMIGPAGVSMERMGSGTTWIPDAVSMPNRRRMLGDWMIMAHGFAFAQYDKQSGERGDDQFGSLNWAMLMATHDLASGRFQARTMLSIDALTVTNRGYPLLLQSGESFDGQPLHDRQHPHDFWMELGALYQRPITKSLAWSIYAAPSGEPALSPVAFMHRPSAMDNPTAPIGHHWQDATHVSFGVLTAGIFAHTWQLEGSVFNGREPDQNRWDFDPIRLDSYSGRFTLNPSSHWSFAGGYGYLKSPEALNPAESMHRVTTSVQHGISLPSGGQIASTFIWAANKHSTMPRLSNSFLLETEAIFDRSNTLFGRSELVQKSAEELVVVDPVVTSKGVLLPGFPAMRHFNVGTAQLGYIREVARTHWATIGLGAAATLNFVPAPLEPYYGSRKPTGMFLFLRLRPFHTGRSSTRATEMGGMEMKPGHD
jgi:hypothetical protein